MSKAPRQSYLTSCFSGEINMNLHLSIIANGKITINGFSLVKSKASIKWRFDIKWWNCIPELIEKKKFFLELYTVNCNHLSDI